MKKTHFLFLLLLGINSVNLAQEKNPDPLEVKTIDGIVKAMYDVISGPAGERDWERLRFLCKPTVQFNMVTKNKEGQTIFRTGDIEKYIQFSGAHFLKYNFYETETARKVHEFGPIAQVFSAYQSTSEPEGVLFDSGVNSIQLCYEQDRWWVVNIMWTSATKENPVKGNF